MRALGPAAARQPQWRTLMTAPFNAGRHVFTVTLLDGAAVQRLRAERKKATGADYVATLRRLGLDVGEAGPVSRAKAEEAMAFVQQRAAALLAGRCGDIVLPDGALRVAGFQPASIAGPGIAPGAIRRRARTRSADPARAARPRRRPTPTPVPPVPPDRAAIGPAASPTPPPRRRDRRRRPTPTPSPIPTAAAGQRRDAAPAPAVSSSPARPLAAPTTSGAGSVRAGVTGRLAFARGRSSCEW